jgi:hypothetical protein
MVWPGAFPNRGVRVLVPALTCSYLPLRESRIWRYESGSWPSTSLETAPSAETISAWS